MIVICSAEKSIVVVRLFNMAIFSFNSSNSEKENLSSSLSNEIFNPSSSLESRSHLLGEFISLFRPVLVAGLDRLDALKSFRHKPG